MRLRSLFYLVLGSLLGSVFVQPAITHAQATATIKGTLTDPSGAAIGGATVAAQSLDSTAAIVRTMSEPSGEFSLKLAPGRYRVSIAHPSFVPAEQEFALAAGDARTWDVRLTLEKLSSSVVVTDAAEPTTAETAPDLVNVITKEQINDSAEIWLAPLLATAPGMSFSRLGPMGGTTSFFLDGGNSSYAKVLVDGVPVNVSEPGFSVDFSNLTVDDVDKIEIVHGASSALYGSDAMSGVVQIFTHRGATRTPELALEGDGGTFGTGHAGGQLSGLLGAFDYSAGAGYFDSSGQGSGDYFRDTTLSGNFGWKLSETDSLRLTLRNGASDAGQPGQTLLATKSPFALDPGQHSELHNFSANVAWNFTSGEHWRSQLLGYESRFQDTDFLPSFDFQALNKFNRAGLDGQSTYSFRNGGVTAGYMFEAETGGAMGRHDQAGYLEARRQFGRLTAIAGGRAEANGSYGTRIVPRVGASYALRDGRGMVGATRLRASYGQGIKEPPLFPADCTPILKPEQSTTVEAGIDQSFASDRVRASVTYFHNDFRDIVSFTSAGPQNCRDFGGSFFNTDKARAFGSNASLEVKATRWLSFAGNYTYDDSRVLKSPNSTDPALVPGNRLLKRPLNSANLMFNAHVRGMNWRLTSYYVGRRTDSDFLSSVVNGVCVGPCIKSDPGYFRLDMAVIVPLRHGFSTTAHFENLLDRHYQDAAGYPALGYNYRVGIKYVWGGEK
ncbi:MAG TPA: TonB-dependent receptor plug domain-containing protein [Candidatus Acidoferrales bacterium]|nr:TonB-dependent receptor plug domain-containing protein [Candidatus Acidoferrales bacterium]